MVRGTKTLDFLPAPKGFVRTTKQSHRHSNVLAMVIGLIWGCGIGHFVASDCGCPSSDCWDESLGLRRSFFYSKIVKEV